MKRIAMLIGLLCLAGVLSAQENTLPKVVRVTGTSEVKVAPDRAVIELGVQKQNPNASATKRAADQASRRILAALKAQGVDEKDVQTTYLSLQPESYTRKGVRISYFVANVTMLITVRDLSRLDSLLEELVKAGGNRIDSIEYEVSDIRKYRDQARELAIKAAREKAQALAQALGQETGKAHSIEEVAEPEYALAGMRANSAYAYEAPAKTLSPSIAPGQKTISASVVVSFDLN
ncbi:MAG TPA: SIMPL domain-containing protein [Candidatus Angelobacter sp.]|nr:SIMPL domain-containing protein [Candidatus Angelobacter sp.]